MTSHAARAKLNYAIRFFGKDTEKIIDFMTNNDFVGEQADSFYSEVDSREESPDAFKERLYKAFGITKKLRQKFESPEFDVNENLDNIRNFLLPILDALIHNTSGVDREDKIDITINGLAEAEFIRRLYKIYIFIRNSDGNEILDGISANRMEISDILEFTDKAFAADLKARCESTVKRKGLPIDTFISQERPEKIPSIHI